MCLNSNPSNSSSETLSEVPSVIPASDHASVPNTACTVPGGSLSLTAVGRARECEVGVIAREYPVFVCVSESDRAQSCGARRRGPGRVRRSILSYLISSIGTHVIFDVRRRGNWMCPARLKRAQWEETQHVGRGSPLSLGRKWWYRESMCPDFKIAIGRRGWV